MKPEDNYWAGILAGILFLGAAVAIALRVEKPELNVALCLTGAAVGWFAGILLSPRNSDEASRFQSYGRAIVTFLSGYVIAKADPVLQALVSSHDWDSLTLFSIRALLVALTLTVGVLVTFAGRNFGTSR